MCLLRSSAVPAQTSAKISDRHARDRRGCAGRGVHSAFSTRCRRVGVFPYIFLSISPSLPVPLFARGKSKRARLNSKTCLDAAKAVRPRGRQRPAAAEPGCSSPWGGSTVSSGKATTRSASAPVRRSISPPLWNIWPPRCSSWLETPPGTTKRLG